MKEAVEKRAKNILSSLPAKDSETVEMYFQEEENDSFFELFKHLFKDLPFERHTITQTKLLEFQKCISWNPIEEFKPEANSRIHILDTEGKVKENCFLINDIYYKETHFYSRMLNQNKEKHLNKLSTEIKEWRYDIKTAIKMVFGEEFKEHSDFEPFTLNLDIQDH